jgi:hypothetical protein
VWRKGYTVRKWGPVVAASTDGNPTWVRARSQPASASNRSSAAALHFSTVVPTVRFVRV